MNALELLTTIRHSDPKKYKFHGTWRDVDEAIKQLNYEHTN